MHASRTEEADATILKWLEDPAADDKDNTGARNRQNAAGERIQAAGMAGLAGVEEPFHPLQSAI